MIRLWNTVAQYGDPSYAVHINVLLVVQNKLIKYLLKKIKIFAGQPTL